MLLVDRVNLRFSLLVDFKLARETCLTDPKNNQHIAHSVYKAYLTSPVKAPPLRTQQFCAATWKSDRSKLFTRGRNTNGGLTTTSAT